LALFSSLAAVISECAPEGASMINLSAAAKRKMVQQFAIKAI
jgi:hypothetical protein